MLPKSSCDALFIVMGFQEPLCQIKVHSLLATSGRQSARFSTSSNIFPLHTNQKLMDPLSVLTKAWKNTYGSSPTTTNLTGQNGYLLQSLL